MMSATDGHANASVRSTIWSLPSPKSVMILSPVSPEKNTNRSAPGPPV